MKFLTVTMVSCIIGLDINAHTRTFNGKAHRSMVHYLWWHNHSLFYVAQEQYLQ